MTEPTLRFAIGDQDGLSSNSWRIWVKPDGDVYIRCRDNYKELKVSLHGDRWRVGFSEEGAASTAHVPTNQENRAWMVWDRPPPVDGITLGFRIFYFSSELSILPADRIPQKWRGVDFVPTGPEGTITLALITLNEPGRTLTVPNEDQYRNFLPLPDGGQVQLTIHSIELDEDFRRSVMVGYRQAVMMGLDFGITVPPTTKFFLTGTSDEGGWPFATEVNLLRPDPDPLHFLED